VKQNKGNGFTKLLAIINVPDARRRGATTEDNEAGGALMVDQEWPLCLHAPVFYGSADRVFAN